MRALLIVRGLLRFLGASSALIMVVLEVNNPDLPASVRRLHDRIGILEKTCGDGACGIHAVFGKVQQGEYRKNNARSFLRNAFGATAEVFAAKLDDAASLDEIKNVLWADLVKPHALEAAGLTNEQLVLRPEGGMVWSHLTHDLVQECIQAVQVEHFAYQKFLEERKRICQKFSHLCVRSLEHSFLRPLLTSLDMLEEYENTQADIRGSEIVQSKFNALFENYPEAIKWRQSIVESCGVSNFRVLFDRVQDIVGGSYLW